MEKRIEFLYKAISDAQDLIKYIESKTAFITAILSGYIATLFLVMENIFQYKDRWPCLFWISFSILSVAILFSLWIIGRLVFPIMNPIKNIKINESEISDIQFFLGTNDYSMKFMVPFFNCKTNKLSIQYNNYLKGLDSLNDDDLIKILTQELLKLSFIRNIKNDRFKVLVVSIVISTLAFICFLIIYELQLKGMTVLQNCCHCRC